ncbi:hypothetical protein D910_00747 [Dendroctonus ponderosae]|uniref:Uncharacterized protein n=1 Tax=Dendroctonus ponderosae TaxID=77166 RepID=U4US96_DENPD|nr:hypothetical protein D910_00747 [Dendroctonus ponderosae]
MGLPFTEIPLISIPHSKREIEWSPELVECWKFGNNVGSIGVGSIKQPIGLLRTGIEEVGLLVCAEDNRAYRDIGWGAAHERINQIEIKSHGTEEYDLEMEEREKFETDCMAIARQNNKLIVHNHISAIFNYPSVKKENHKELRSLNDNQLDIFTRKEWEPFKCQSELPLLNELQSFLQDKCEVLEKMETCKAKKDSASYKEDNNQGFRNKYSKESRALVSTENKGWIVPNKINHLVKEVGQQLLSIDKQVEVVLKSQVSPFQTNLKCLVLPKITDKLPLVSFDQNIFEIPSELVLADPKFNVRSEIDLLLGSQVFWTVLGSKHITLRESMPVLHDSLLGWILAGNLVLLKTNCKFWQLEEVDPGTSPVFSAPEKYCDAYFEQTTKRDEDGRFIVRIPFKNNLGKLGFSRAFAWNRFEALEKRFLRNPNLKEQYQKFMGEYESNKAEAERTHANKGRGEEDSGRQSMFGIQAQRNKYWA